MPRTDTWAHRDSGRTCTGPAAKRAALLLVVLIVSRCVSLGQASGQNLQTAEQPTTVRGTVVNAVTRAPISRALVYSDDNRFAALTDGGGHFEFALPKAAGDTEPGTIFEGQRRPMWLGALPGDSSWLMARKPGFLGDPNDRRRVQATPGDGITIALMPEGLIKGRAIVSDADPATGVMVLLFSRQVEDGIPRWVQASTVRANSNGEFRFAELQAGTYKVGTMELMDNDPVSTIPGGQMYGFPPVYYPGVPDIGTAGTIALGAGQEVQIDLPLTRQPYYPVSIPVANPDDSGGMNISVSVQGHRGPGYSLGYNAQKQRIEGSLPSGNYLVEASTYGQLSATGAVNIAVAGAGAEGPTITLTRSSSILAHVSEEFTSTQSNVMTSTWIVGGRSFPVHGPRLYLQIRVETEDDFERQRGAVPRPPTGPNDDSMVIENVTPGRYWLRLSSSRGYVAAATMGGVDLLREPLVVAPGSTVPIEIRMRDDTAELDGTVTGLAAEPALAEGSPGSGYSAPQAWVYCLPLPGSPGDFQELGVSGTDGKFMSESMVPGTYRVLAFRNPQPSLPYRDAEAMKAYDSLGPVVHLSPGQKTNVQVQIVSSGD